MNIILKRGPLDRETDDNLPDACVVYRRSARGPNARYRITEAIENGRHVFEHWPPKPDEPEHTEAVYDA